MGLWLRGWLTVGTAVALLGGLLWLGRGRDRTTRVVAERGVGIRGVVGCGVIWLGLEYAQGVRGRA